MTYDISDNDNKEFVLDDSEIKETVNIIENLTDKKLNVEIKNQDQLQTLLDDPEELLDDEELIEDIKNLKELIKQMSDVYYAE